MPGVKKEDLNIELENGLLSISAKRENSYEKKEDGRYFYTERNYGSFSRSIRVPDDVGEDNVQAKYEDGVLTLNLVKDANKKRRTIMIE